MRRYGDNETLNEGTDAFIKDIQEEIKRKGIKNAVCIVLGDNDDVSVIEAFENSVQTAGILDLGKTCFHSDVLD